MLTGVQFIEVKDDPRYDARSNTVIRERRYTYYIDQHGPFTARVSLDPFDPQAIERHVMETKTHLATLPR